MARKIFDAEDLAALERVLTSGQLSWLDGAAAREFEARAAARLGCKHAIAIHSAMAGLQYGLMVAGVGEGDEVICDSTVPFGAYATLSITRPLAKARHTLVSSFFWASLHSIPITICCSSSSPRC